MADRNGQKSSMRTVPCSGSAGTSQQSGAVLLCRCSGRVRVVFGGEREGIPLAGQPEGWSAPCG